MRYELSDILLFSSIAALEELNGTCKQMQIIMTGLLYIIPLITRLLSKINRYMKYLFELKLFYLYIIMLKPLREKITIT